MARKLSDALAGDNVNPSIIQACAAEYAELDTQMKRVAQKVAAMFARYEGQGINVRAIKNAHRLARQDRRAASEQAKTDLRYLIVTGVLNPANDEWVTSVTQTDMFADEGNEIGKLTPNLAKARAHMDGYNTGRLGGDVGNNLHPGGTAEHVAWQKGFADGVADRALKPGLARVKRADTATKTRRPRGRPPGKRRNGQDQHA